VVQDYGGDAGRIWGDNPTAKELQARLDAFEGIGQKKAAMAVAMLARDLSVPIRAMEGNDVAYDVHIRRVFLRTGLAQRDDPKHLIEVARELNPKQPSALDLPAWLVGRSWCRPDAPRCPECPIEAPCPRLLDRAAGVAGV
jgi:endonuclease III